MQKRIAVIKNFIPMGLKTKKNKLSALI